MAKGERSAEATAIERPDSGRPKLPLPPSKNISIEELIEYWQNIPHEFRNRLLGYLYRLWPIIKRTPGYIDKFAEAPASKDAILRQHGTGEYEIRLTDLDKPKGSEICRARFKFAELYSDCPPILEPLELDIGRKENAGYVEWLRSTGRLKMPNDTQANDASATVLARALVDMAAAKNQPAQGSIENTALKSALDLMGDATKQAISTVKAQQDPAGVSGMLKELKEFVKPAPTADPLEILKNAKEIFGGGGNDKLVELLLKLQSDNSKALADAQQKNMELLLKLVEDKRESGDMLNQVEKIAATTSALREAFGGEGGGGGRPGKWGWLQDIAGAALGPNGTFSQLAAPVGMWLASKVAGFGRGPQPGAPGAPGPGVPPMQPMPPALPGAAPPFANPAANPAQPGAAPAAGDPQEQFMGDQIRNLFGAIAMPLMKFLREGRHGDEFADYLIEGGMLDAIQLNQIRQIGREKLMGMLRSDQMAWQFIGPIEPQFSAFLDEFLAWQPEAEGTPE